MTQCICGSKKTTCCLNIIQGKSDAKSPEQLMRSRYTAFALGYAQYLYDTSSEALRQQFTVLDLQQSCDNSLFVKLEVLKAVNAQVEFKAHYIEDGMHCILHERSVFIKQTGGWKYDRGDLFETKAIGLQKNSACPCDSGKKFKNCHMVHAN